MNVVHKNTICCACMINYSHAARRRRQVVGRLNMQEIYANDAFFACAWCMFVLCVSQSQSRRYLSLVRVNKYRDRFTNLKHTGCLQIARSRSMCGGYNLLVFSLHRLQYDNYVLDKRFVYNQSRHTRSACITRTKIRRSHVAILV